MTPSGGALKLSTVGRNLCRDLGAREIQLFLGQSSSQKTGRVARQTYGNIPGINNEIFKLIVKKIERVSIIYQWETFESS